MDEKRRHPRFDSTLPVTLRHNGHLFPATALDVSSGGMHLQARGSGILPGGKAEIIFDLGANCRDLSLRGRITRVAAAGNAADVGIQFTSLFSPSHKTLLKHLQK